MGTHGNSFQAEKAALRDATQWLSSISSRASAIVICDCQSLVQVVSNSNSNTSSIIQLQAAVAVLAMSRSILIVCAPGHCGLSGIKLTDRQATLHAAVTQSDITLEPATQRDLIHRSCHPPPIQHERLKEVFTSVANEQIETSFAKTEHTDFARFLSGRHPALRRWQHLVGVSEVAVCRLCGEEVVSAEQLWQRCLVLLVERHHSDLGHRTDELVCV